MLMKYCRHIIRRTCSCLVRISTGRFRWSICTLLLWAALSLVTLYWLGELTGRALRVPPPPDQNLQHFRRRNDLQYYLDNIPILVEPSIDCAEVPVIIMVASRPSNGDRRGAIRHTWGKHQPTFFLLGLENEGGDDQLVDVFAEARVNNDLIVFNMSEHFQNLTLKTMLMLQWTLDRCPLAKYMCKTDDDVFINPWTFNKVIEENPGAILLGYKVTNTSLHRDEYNKWYVPRWLCSVDFIPEYITGVAYLINGKYINKILTAAKKVRLMNLEDVYLTYLVSKSTLNLKLTHDRRLSLFKPWFRTDCAYWSLAASHSYEPKDVDHAWERIRSIAKDYEKGSRVCEFYAHFLDSEFLLIR